MKNKIQSANIHHTYSKTKTLILGYIAALGNMVLGYVMVCLSEIQTLLMNENHLTQTQTDYQLSLATSSLSFGGIIGVLIYKKLQDKLGKKDSLIIIDVIGTLCILGQLYSLTVAPLTVCRFFLGAVLGISTSIIPGYLNSIAKKQYSGILGSFNQLQIVTGIMFAYLLGYLIQNPADTLNLHQSFGAEIIQVQKILQFSIEIRWRIFLGAPMICLLIRIFGLLILHPKNQLIFQKSQQSIQLPYNQNTSQEENQNELGVLQYGEKHMMNTKMTQSQKQLQLNQLQVKNKLKKRKRFTFSFKKRFLVGIFVIASNQISCINGIFYYAKQLLNSITKDQKLSQDLLMGLALSQIIANLLSGRLIDKYGRRSIFLIGQIIIVCILTLVFILDLKQMNFLSLSYKHSMMILLIFLHVIIFNISLGPICIFYCSQILDDLTQVILTLKSLSLFFALWSDFMIKFLGIGNMFLIFAIFSFIVNLYLQKNMLQTKQLSRLDIKKIFQKLKSNKEQSVNLIDSKIPQKQCNKIFQKFQY